MWNKNLLKVSKDDFRGIYNALIDAKVLRVDVRIAEIDIFLKRID